jgi:transcriptional regulator with XRE-family HTH domain
MSLNPIKLARLESGMTQWAVAHRAGISESRLSRIENGLISPSPDVLRKIASVLRLPVEKLSSDGPKASKQ